MAIETTGAKLKAGTARRLAVLAVAASVIMCASTASASEKSAAKEKADSLAGLFSVESSGIPAFDSSTTLDDYLQLAFKRNPNLRSAYYRWVADLKKSDYAGALPDPMFSYGYFVQPIETRVGPQEQRFGIRQPFPWFGTLGAKKNAAFAMSQASYEKFSSEQLKIIYQIKAAFYDYYYIGRELSITRENMDLLTFWESVVNSKYTVGLSKHPDLMKVQVELGKLEDRIRTLDEMLEPAAARMRALLDLPDSLAIPVPSEITVSETELADDSVLSAIKQHNPDLRALEFMIEKEKAGVSLAKKASLPGFSIGVDYIQTGAALNPSMAESGKDAWMISGSISLPIWFGKNNARKGEAVARQYRAEYDLRASENQLVAVGEKILFEYSDALRKTRLYRDGLVPKAQQSLNASYAAYEAGNTDFLNVLDAQRQLLDFELTVAHEKATLATKRAQLEMLIGGNIDPYMQQ